MHTFPGIKNSRRAIFSNSYVISSFRDFELCTALSVCRKAFNLANLFKSHVNIGVSSCLCSNFLDGMAFAKSAAAITVNKKSVVQGLIIYLGG